MASLKVGLMGLGAGGRRVADALMTSSWCELVAVASQQTRRIEEFTEAHPGIAAFDDFRSLIVSNPLDALFVAVPPFLRVKYLALAAERSLPVWMLTPAARRLDEALEILGKFESAGCPIVVSRDWGIEPALQAEALSLDRAGTFFLARGHVMLCLPEDLDWRGDSHRAAGGVLLYQGYRLIDTLVQAMGTPTTVYAVAAGVSRPGGRFPYDTEDTAAIVCQFPGGGAGVISACWTAGPPQMFLHLQGAQQSIQIDADQVVVRDRSGQEEISRQDRPANPLQCQIEEFLSSLCSSPRRMEATLRRHLPTMGVIQAAYLSARTGQPESPGALFEMHHIEEVPEDEDDEE
jgi:predicted dehydrogenase